MRLLALLLVLALSGCMDGPGPEPEPFATGVTPQQRAGDEVWVLYVHGDEDWDRRGGSGPEVMCSIAWQYELDRPGRSIRYNDDLGIDVATAEALVASQVFGRGDCPVSYDLADAGAGEAVDLDLGILGDHRVAVQADGTLVLDGHHAPLGQGLRLSGEATRRMDGTTYRVTSEVSFEVLGAWPKENIEAA